MKTRILFSYSMTHRGVGYKSTHMPTKRSRVLGVTIIELIITVLIVGILTTAAIPAYTGFVESQRVKTASFDTISALNLARSEALKRNVNVSIAPLDGNWINGMQVIASDVAATVINKINRSPGVIITCRLAGAAVDPCPNFTYNPSGRTGVAPSIQISNTSGSNRRCISINLSGRPNSQTGACA